MSKARELAELGNVYSDGALSNRNLIINGDLNVSQRNGTNSVTHSSGSLTYNADRWFVFAAGASVTGQVVTGTNTGTNRAYKITGASGVTDLNFAQRIESLNVRHLDGEKVTLSFKMYASQALSGVSATIFFGTADDTGYGNTNVSNSLTVNSGLNTYEETFTLSSVASRGFEVAIAFGSNLPSGATVEIAQVQLEVGDTATPFEHRSYGQELALCQRYCKKLNVGGSAYSGITNAGSTFSTIKFNEMRSAPTLLPTGVTGYGGGSTEYRVYICNQAGGGFISPPATASIGITYATTTSARIDVTHSSSWFSSSFDTTGALVEIGSSIKLILDAEL